MTTSRNDDAPDRREASLRSHAVTQTGLPDDPLGYDTSDMRACALAMAEAALSGRNKAAVAAEIAAVERRLGRRRKGAEQGGT